jgi:dTDP-4-dehydrorhamnose 3,5-epimerase
LNFAVERLSIPDIVVVRPRRFGDERGWFMETYREDAFVALGIPASFVQDNQAFSQAAGTVRGLHFQAPSQAQAKLVRVLNGAIYDVAVDIRKASPTYGRWSGVRLSAAGGEALFVPAGFAHGYCTLDADTEVAYKCDAYYSPELEGGLAATDPEIGIDWPFAAEAMTLSAKDRALPMLRDLKSPFEFEPTARADNQ